MNVIYTEPVKQSGDTFTAIQRATEQFERALGRSAGRVTATWDRTGNGQGHPLYTLKLEEPRGSSVGRFTPDQMTSPHRVQFHMHMLWEDVLRAYTEELRQKAMATEG